MKFKQTPLVAYLCLLPLLLALGIWQLKRADEKRAILGLQQQQQSAESLALSAKSPDALDAYLYRPVQATGHYDSSHQFLLDNQVHQGKAGFFVLTPLLLKQEKKAVLVNRGWVALGKTRADLPDVSVPQHEITLSGRINRFPRVGLQLAGAKIATPGWPSVVQVVDKALLSKQLAYPVFSFQIELDATAAYGFTRAWQQAYVMTPEKHTGYAVQWFLLALTLTVLFIKYGIDKEP